MTTGRLAEQSVRDILETWGLTSVRLTPPGSDGGIDVVAPGIVVQVKDLYEPVSRPELQRLVGAALVAEAKPLFFSTSRYTNQAITWANRAQLPLFHLVGIRALPVNHLAHDFLHNTAETPEQQAQREAAEEAALALESEQAAIEMDQAEQAWRDAALATTQIGLTWPSGVDEQNVVPTPSLALTVGEARTLTWFSSLDVGVSAGRLLWTGTHLVAVGEEGASAFSDDDWDLVVASADLRHITSRRDIDRPQNDYRTVAAGTGRVFLAGGLGAGHQSISALDTSGNELWTRTFPDHLLGLLAVQGNRVIGELDSSDWTKQSRAIAGWSADDGELLWRSGPSTNSDSYSRPAIFDERIFVLGTADHVQSAVLVEIDARTGKWERSQVIPAGRRGEWLSPASTPLAIAADRVLVPVPSANRYYQWELWGTDGNRLWCAPTQAGRAAVIATAGGLIITSEPSAGYDQLGNVSVLSAANGSQVAHDLDPISWAAQGTSTAWAGDGSHARAFFADGSVSPAVRLPDIGSVRTALVVEQELAILYLAVGSVIHGFLIQDAAT